MSNKPEQISNLLVVEHVFTADEGGFGNTFADENERNFFKPKRTADGHEVHYTEPIDPELVKRTRYIRVSHSEGKLAGSNTDQQNVVALDAMKTIIESRQPVQDSPTAA